MAWREVGGVIQARNESASLERGAKEKKGGEV